MRLPLPESDIFSLNGMYLMQFFNAVIRNKNEEEFFWGITDLNNFTDLHNLHLLLDSLIIKKFKTIDVDVKDTLKEIMQLGMENEKVEIEYIERILKKLFIKKYEPHLKIRKSISFFNSYQVMDKIFELIGEEYYKMIYEPTMEACVKVYQLYEWTYLNEFSEKDEIEKDQIVFSGLLKLYNSYEEFIAVDNRLTELYGHNFIDFYNKWTKRIESLLAQTDVYDVGITIRPLSQMIYQSMFSGGEDYIEIFKRSRGGKSSTNEAYFMTQIYDYLGILKSERKVPILNAPFVDVKEEEPFVYDSTRDDWVNSLRTDFVQIMTKLNTIRGLNASPKTFTSSQSIRTMVMRYKKDLSEDNT